MPNLTNLTKTQLIDLIQEIEETKFNQFKVEFGLTYNTDEEWIDFIKGLKKDEKEIEDLRAIVNHRNTRPPN